MQSGVINEVKTINNIDIPSIPNFIINKILLTILYLQQIESSDVVGSN